MEDQAPVFELHSYASTEWLFAFNVFFSAMAYLTVFGEALLVPFQTMVMPKAWGPNWLYVFVLFMLQLEYHLWPLEVNAYLFKTDREKAMVLAHNDTLDEYKSSCLLWGSVFTGITFIFATAFASLTADALQYISKPWFYVGAFGSYSVQNWMFLWYLSSVESEPGYVNIVQAITQREKEIEEREAAEKAAAQAELDKEIAEQSDEAFF